jgi:hypothetical protein
LPTAAERTRYVDGWRRRLEAEMRISEADAAALVEESDGFSFAYLKELFLSSMIRWMKERSAAGMAAILRTQLATLREQMRTDPAATPERTAAAERDDA